MQLNNLKSAWTQIKFINAMPHLASEEILSIIETPEQTRNNKIKRVVIEAAFFILITVIFQSG